ncbi:MAG TPA: hypothetical protein H9986_02750 [Candidatus Prevotella stercoripullorum]|nr:hypothetical protein [Candidatus Prevotella stercoripullorum]
MRQKLSYILTAALALCAWSCSDDAGDYTEAPETGVQVEVPVTVTFGGAWDTDDEASRAAPPEQGDGLETNDKADIDDIDRVRIVTFRRKDASVVGGETGDFVYDPSNDYTVTCQHEDDDQRKEAHATLTKTYGYEYRVVAIAYPAKDEGWFKLNTNVDGLRFQDFEATIQEQPKSAAGGFDNDRWDAGTVSFFYRDLFKVLYTPHFFYGYCHAEGNEDDPIIKFDNDEDNMGQTPLTGILYRAVAKVEVRLEVQPVNYGESNYNIYEIALLMNNVYTNTGLTAYDDFLKPQTPITIKDKAEENYILCKYENNIQNKGEMLTLTTYVLPTKTRLGLAVRGELQAGVVYASRKGWFEADNLSFGDGATGVISPDVNGNYFYFRRNHKYVITGNTNNAKFIDSL